MLMLMLGYVCGILLACATSRSNSLPDFDLPPTSPHPRHVLLVIAYLLLHPTAASCPPGYDLRTGIRRSGIHECWPAPVAPAGWSTSRLGPIKDWDGTWQRPERSVQPNGVLTGRIWCSTEPVVLDER